MQGRCPVALQLVKSHFDVALSSPTANGRRATEKNVTLAVTSVPCVIKNHTLKSVKISSNLLRSKFLQTAKELQTLFFQ